MHPKNANGVANRVLFRLVLNIPLTLLHSEWPNLYGVLSILSAIGLSYSFLFRNN